MDSALLTIRPASSDRGVLFGILLFLVAMAILPVMDGFAKYLGATVPVVEIVWARFTFHTALILPIAFARYGITTVLRPPKPHLQVVRSLLLVMSTVFFFGALRYLPLADALALIFINPIIVTVLAPFCLGEKVGLRRWLAVIVGFAGTLIIIRPGFAELNAGTGLAIAAGVSIAAYFLLTRRLSGTSEPLVTLAYTGVVGAVVSTGALPFFWVTPSWPELAMMIGIGLIAAVGHYLIIRAYDHAPAPVLAPFGYAEIVMATVVGYVAFGDIPDRWTALGVVVLIASGLYISVREGTRRDRRAESST
jgi:drug/metabolite transporter (DMT)-like permease